MYCVQPQPITTARHIARSAQQQIKDRTGIKVTLVLYPADNTLKPPEQMLDIIAFSLDMSADSFKLKSRAREIVELRFLAALILRRNYPAITLNQIAALFGGQDHTSILNGLAKANNLIYTGETRFIRKYHTALKSVNIWLRKED